ncbi:hypothetical protein TNCV_3903751 [Trichonephila clavipes]|nr:hypothetical protein TNCV_3903751 [Trichonephila clavipes]
MNNSNSNASPSPIASRTRGTNDKIRKMVRLRTCPICSYKANSLTALKHHLLRHNGSLERKRALRAISKQLNTTSTPVARSRAGVNLPHSMINLGTVSAEFQSSSSSSPEQNSSGEKEVMTTAATSSPKVKVGNCSPPTSIDALAL